MSKKVRLSKLFLYKNRFIIGYILLCLAFFALVFGLPLFTPAGLSEAEMQSVVTSNSISASSVMEGNIVNLPYHALQKISITIFGVTAYAIKLPSIIIGAFLGILLILLLNRWFKNNVAILSCILTVLSSSFLYLAGSGTPLIMFVFWPVVLLWLGSKIQGVKKPRPLFCFIFAFALLASLFTPYLAYLAIFICIYVLFTPHLRFTLKNLPKALLFFTGLIVIAGCSFIAWSAIKQPDTITSLFFTNDFNWDTYLSNIKDSLLPFFSWNGMVESTFLAPLISLPSLFLALVGLFSTARGFFASRNSIATYLIIYTLIIAGFEPTYAILLIVPFAILIAHGLRYILNKWYGIFPENPYARIFGVLPVATFMLIMIFSDISHFFFGYRYNPPVSNQFTSDLAIISDNAIDGDRLLISSDSLEYSFYEVYSQNTPILGERPTVQISSLEDFNELMSSKDAPTPDPESPGRILSFGKLAPLPKQLSLSRIITSSKSSNSDRIYIYTYVSPEKDKSKNS